MVETTVIFDRLYGKKSFGKYTQSIIVKFSNTYPGILFGDKLNFEKDDETGDFAMELSGLRIFFEKINTHSKSVTMTLDKAKIMEQIDYAVLLGDDIVEGYDAGRFGSFMTTIRFAKTQGLFYEMDDGKCDHRTFVSGEILNRAAAVMKNSGIIIADRLFINENILTPTFFDAILISRDEKTLNATYEPWYSCEIDDLRMIALLGAENF